MQKKRFLSKVLVFVMLFSMIGGIPTVSAAGTTATENGFTIELNTGTITSYNSTTGGAIEIPSTIGGVAATAIGQSAFEGDNITSVTIPSSVKSIEQCSLFGKCSNFGNRGVCLY